MVAVFHREDVVAVLGRGFVQDPALVVFWDHIEAICGPAVYGTKP